MPPPAVPFLWTSRARRLFLLAALASGLSIQPLSLQADPPVDGPDLVVSNLVVNGGQPVYWGEPLLIQWTLLNAGTAPVTNLAISDQVVMVGTNGATRILVAVVRSFGTAAPIRPGETRARQFDLPRLDDLSVTEQHLVVVKTDWNRTVAEANPDGTAEANNNSEVQVHTVGPRIRPDLVVTSVELPDEVFTSIPFQLTYVVRNAGTAPAEGAWVDRFSMRLTASGSGFSTKAEFAQEGPLAPGESRTNVQWVTLGRSEHLTSQIAQVETDAKQQVAEFSGEDNNDLQASHYVLVSRGAVPHPDLVVSRVIVPVEAFTDQPVPVTWTILNAGTMPVTNSWTDMVLLSPDAAYGADRVLHSFAFAGVLAPGETVSRTHAITIVKTGTTERDYWFILATDAGNFVDEQEHETNNITVAETPTHVRFALKPNLRVFRVGGPTSAYAGVQTVVEWGVTNSGTLGTGQRFWYDRLYLSANTSYERTDFFLGETKNLSYLNPGEAYSQSMAVKIPPALQGRFYLLAYADYWDDLDEGDNEADNVRVGPAIQLTIPPAPDLVVTALHVPERSFAGEQVSLTYSVVNRGTAAVPMTDWHDGIYLSTNVTLETSAGALRMVAMRRSLGIGEGYTNTVRVRLPLEQLGTNYIGVKLDATRLMEEQAGEGNNTTATPIEILPAPPADLEVASVSAPAEGFGGLPLALSYRVANLGPGKTPGSFWMDQLYFLSEPGASLVGKVPAASWTRVGALEPGAAYTNHAVVNAPLALDGSYYAVIKADGYEALPDLDRDNNVRAALAPTQFHPAPSDLALTSLDAPAQVAADGILQLGWRVTNLGPALTVATQWVDRVVLSRDTFEGNEDDAVLLTRTHESRLAPGAEVVATNQSVAMPFEFGPGVYNLWLEVDAGHAVYDPTRTNNFSSIRQLTVTGGTADLQVEFVEAPATVLPGDTVPIGWQVRNRGAGPVRENQWKDRVYLSPTNVLDRTAHLLVEWPHEQPLSAAAAYSNSVPCDLSGLAPGSYFVLVQTDVSDEARETGAEENNLSDPAPRLEILDVTLADLAVISVEAPSDAVAGQQFEVRYTVKNLGQAPAHGPWWDGVFLSLDQVFDHGSDLNLGSRDAGVDLAGGESYTITNRVSLPRNLQGPFYVFVLADAGFRVEHAPRGPNNAGYDPVSMLVRVHPPVDLVAGVITVPPTATAGQSMWLTYRVTNLGTQPAEGSWYDALYLSQDTLWDVDDPLLVRVEGNGPLGPGQTYTNTVSAALPAVLPGSYYVILRTDLRDFVNENNEGNNVAASLDRAVSDITTLLLDVPATGRLRPGAAACFQFQAEAGRTLELRLDSAATVGFNEIYVRYGAPPDRAHFDFLYPAPGEPDQRLLVPRTEAGTYYVWIYANSGPNGQTPYTLTARYPQFELTSLEPARGGNMGEVTVQIAGAALDRMTRLELVSGTRVQPARWSRWVDETRLLATFDLRGLPAGHYGLRAHAEERDVTIDRVTGQITPFVRVYGDVTLADAFEVVEGGGPLCRARLLLPISERVDRPFPFYLEVSNPGLNDLPVPVYVVSSSSGTAIAPTIQEVQSNSRTPLTSQQLLVLGARRPMVLSPGETARITLWGLDLARSGAQFHLRRMGDIAGEVGWPDLERFYYNRNDPDWAGTWSRFLGLVGTTWVDLETVYSALGAELAPKTKGQVLAGTQLIRELLAHARYDLPIRNRVGETERQDSPPSLFGCCEDPVVAQGRPRVRLAGAGSDCPPPVMTGPCLETDASDEALVAAYEYTRKVCLGGLYGMYFFFGWDVGDLWKMYLSSTPASPTPEQVFDGPSNIGVGFREATEIEEHLDTIEPRIKTQFGKFLAEMGCDYDDGFYELKDVFDKEEPVNDMMYKPATNFGRPWTIPGNIAGGAGWGGGRCDTREYDGRVEIETERDECDKIKSIRCKLTSEMIVRDTIDFCPGDPGSRLERLCTAPMTLLEANGWAYDVPFRVEFEPWARTFDIPLNFFDKECVSSCGGNPPDSCFKPCDDPCGPPGGSGGGGGGGGGDCCSPDVPQCDNPPPVRPDYSKDPNDILGPAGTGPEHWVGSGQTLDYTIRFENDPLYAGAPAQEVLITQTLDPDLDWRTFRLRTLTLGDLHIAVPPNRAYYQDRLDLRAQCGLMVDVIAGVNVVSGEVFWQLTSVDPATGDLPLDPLAGFLPPNLTAPEGEGSVSYSILPRASAPTGTRLEAQAEIVFDLNAPLLTPACYNTLDAAAPSSRIQSVAPTADETLHYLAWTGEEDAGGSGLRTLDVFVSVDGRPPEPILSRTSLSGTFFTLTPGHQFSFFTRASDAAGNYEPAPATADLTTVVPGPAPFLWPIPTLVTDEDTPLREVPFTVQDTSGALDQLTFEVASSNPALLPPSGVVVSGQGNQRTLAVFPAPDRWGVATLTLTVRNAHHSSARTFDTVVRAANDPPIAGTDEFVRLPGSILRMPVAQLLANDRDLEGDLLRVSSVQPRSANRASVRLAGEWLEYQPVPGDDRDDQLSYTVTDASGASGTGQISVLVERFENGVTRHRLGVELRPDGAVVVQFVGLPGKDYTLQTADVLPASSWQDLVTQRTDAGGGFVYWDRPPAGTGARYYRTVTFP